MENTFSLSTEMDLTEEEFDEIDQYVKQKALIPPIVTSRNLCSIYQCPDKQMYRARLQFLFHLDEHVDDQIQLDALIDMVHAAVLFSSNQPLTYPKTIVFLSIYLEIFKTTMRINYFQPQKIFDKCTNLIMKHAVDRPPFSCQVFELDDVVKITDFFVHHYFKHLKLILNCFAPTIILNFESVMPVFVEVPQLIPLSQMEMEQSNKESQISISSSQVLSENKSKSSSRTSSPKSPRTSFVPPTPQHDIKERSVASFSEPANDKPSVPNPEVPVDVVLAAMSSIHQRFVQDFDSKERFLASKIKELEIRSSEKAATLKRQAAPKKK